MEQEKHTPSPTLVEEYRRQMMELYGRQSPPPQEDNWLDSRFPEPESIWERETIATDAPTPLEPVTPTESPYIGYLRVFAFTGEGAEPLEGARVVVSRQEDSLTVIYANLTTDRDGYTPVISLPSVDPALSQRPGNQAPYTAYDIRVVAEGFQPVEYRDTPIYGNNYVTQPAAMLPLLPGDDAEQIRQYFSGGPTNL